MALFEEAQSLIVEWLFDLGVEHDHAAEVAELSRRERNQTREALAILRDNDLFARRGAIDQLRQLALRLVEVDFYANAPSLLAPEASWSS